MLFLRMDLLGGVSRDVLGVSHDSLLLLVLIDTGRVLKGIVSESGDEDSLGTQFKSIFTDAVVKSEHMVCGLHMLASGTTSKLYTL